MASIFANNRILPNLKKRSRSTKSDASSPTKARPLHILPDVAEEDEYSSRRSSSSQSSVPNTTWNQPSRYIATSATLGARPAHSKRDSRRVVLTGIEGLTFDDFFPPASAPRARTPSPSPPPSPRTPIRSVASSPSSQSPLDDLNLRFSGLGISLDFPSPPSSATHMASLSRRREQSPSPSVVSSDASTCSPHTPCSTPPTSDDDESPSKSNLQRAPTYKSQHASVLFLNSMSDLGETVRKSSITSFVEDDISEEVEWIARDLSGIVTLATPVAPTFPLTPSETSFDTRARPDSVLPQPRKHDRSRVSKPLPVLPRISVQEISTKGPSAQLDPTFPLKRRSYMVPSRPPPPPPVLMPASPSLSIMEQATDELLAELANAALGAGFLGTELTVPLDMWSSAGSLPPTPSSQFIVTTPSDLRPPPRSSVPADIFDFCEDSPVEYTVPRRRAATPQPHHPWPTTPQSFSGVSQFSDSPPASPLSSFDFDIDVAFARDSRVESSCPSRSPSSLSVGADAERTLRSRWSTSTLGSLTESHSHSWLPRFTLSPSKKSKSKAALPPAPCASPSLSSSSLLQRKNAVKGTHATKRSMDSDRGSALGRHDSRSSRLSASSASDSGESTTSAGLKRKPIPLTLLSITGSGRQKSIAV